MAVSNGLCRNSHCRPHRHHCGEARLPYVYQVLNREFIIAYDSRLDHVTRLKLQGARPHELKPREIIAILTDPAPPASPKPDAHNRQRITPH